MMMMKLSQIHFISVMFSNLLAQQHKCQLMIMMMVIIIIIISTYVKEQ